MKKYATKLPLLFIAAGLILGLILAIFALNKAPVYAYVASDNCPDGGDWHKDEDGPTFDYTANPGYVIVEVCVKSGSAMNEGGYKVFFTEDGWYEQPAGFTCVGAFGIDTDYAYAIHGEAAESVCGAISHASFRVEQEYTPTPEDTYTPTPEDTYTPTPEDTYTPTPEDTYTPTPEDTYTPTPEDTITPTGTLTEPPKEDTPTPTATETEPPEEDTPTPTATETDPPKEDTPTPQPTDTPQPADTPDVPAGGRGPSMVSILTLLVLSGGSVAFVSYLITKVRKA